MRQLRPSSHEGYPHHPTSVASTLPPLHTLQYDRVISSHQGPYLSTLSPPRLDYSGTPPLSGLPLSPPLMSGTTPLSPPRRDFASTPPLPGEGHPQLDHSTSMGSDQNDYQFQARYGDQGQSSLPPSAPPMPPHHRIVPTTSSHQSGVPSSLSLKSINLNNNGIPSHALLNRAMNPLISRGSKGRRRSPAGDLHLPHPLQPRQVTVDGMPTLVVHRGPTSRPSSFETVGDGSGLVRGRSSRPSSFESYTSMDYSGTAPSRDSFESAVAMASLTTHPNGTISGPNSRRSSYEAPPYDPPVAFEPVASAPPQSHKQKRGRAFDSLKYDGGLRLGAGGGGSGIYSGTAVCQSPVVSPSSPLGGSGLYSGLGGGGGVGDSSGDDDDGGGGSREGSGLGPSVPLPGTYYAGVSGGAGNPGNGLYTSMGSRDGAGPGGIFIRGVGGGVGSASAAGSNSTGYYANVHGVAERDRSGSGIYIGGSGMYMHRGSNPPLPSSLGTASTSSAVALSSLSNFQMSSPLNPNSASSVSPGAFQQQQQQKQQQEQPQQQIARVFDELGYPANDPLFNPVSGQSSPTEPSSPSFDGVMSPTSRMSDIDDDDDEAPNFKDSLKRKRREILAERDKYDEGLDDVDRSPNKKGPQIVKGGVTCQWKGCSRSFSDLGQLGDHLKKDHIARQKATNRKEKKNGYLCEWAKCSRVGKPFKGCYNLEHHLRYQHTGEKPYFCPKVKCTSRFAQRSDLREHMRKIHPDYVDPNPVKGRGSTTTKKAATARQKQIARLKKEPGDQRPRKGSLPPAAPPLPLKGSPRTHSRSNSFNAYDHEQQIYAARAKSRKLEHKSSPFASTNSSPYSSDYNSPLSTT